MHTIYKYPIRVTDFQEVMMPKGAKILSTEFQNAALCIWAMVDTEAEDEPRVIEIHGTGNPVCPTNKREFIGTVLMGPLVWHVFESLGI